MKKTVVVLGASNNEEKYSFKACKELLNHGHTVIPVKPKLGALLGQKAYDTLQDIPKSVAIDTLTVYVGEAISASLTKDIEALHPERVIFNPGAENKPLMTELNKQGIETLEACTLVMLKTNQF